MTDRVLRAMTDDSMFRVVVAETSATAREIASLQQAERPTADHLTNLVTSSILFRETMSPDLRVQWILRGAEGHGRMIADSHPSGATRGVLRARPGTTNLRLEQGTSLQVMRTLPNGQLNQGVVELDGLRGLADAFMLYMQRSEQIESVVAMGTRFEGDDVTRAGGFVVQLLPDLNRAHLAIMVERLRDFENLTTALGSRHFDASWLLDELLWGMPYTLTSESPVRAECWCSELRVMTALASLGRAELEELARSGSVLEIDCDYCRHHYELPPGRLSGLLSES